MAYQSLKQKLFAAALLNPRLVYLLGGGSPLVLRWFDQQLPQAAGTGFPGTYVGSGRLPTSWARMQFTVYGTGFDSQNADAIVQALADFLDTFSADGVTGRPACPCNIISDRDMGIAATQPMTWMRVVDCRIFWNGTV